MSRPPSAYAIMFITCALWCIASGTFLERQFAIGANPLFWALWSSICVNIWLALLLLDAYWQNRQRGP